MSTRRALQLAALAAIFAVACSREDAPDGAAASGPAAAVETATDASLGETFGITWRLVRINSMDDTVTTPDERARYTLTFDAGGQVAVVADCNRGAGTFEWSDDSRLEFGPLAMTRAMCPPESISDRFVRELGYVRSYVIRDGMLHLATMADGAILDFEPAPDE